MQSPRGTSEGLVMVTSGFRMISLPFLKGNGEGAPGLPRRHYISRRRNSRYILVSTRSAGGKKKRTVSYFLIFETVLQICLQYVTLF